MSQSGDVLPQNSGNAAEFEMIQCTNTGFEIDQPSADGQEVFKSLTQTQC